MSEPDRSVAEPAQRCRFCGSGLAAGAEFCTECERFQSWDGTCWACRSPMDRDAERCPACGELQSGVECRACRALLPPRAKVCRECKSLQIFDGYLQVGQATLALVIALVSVLGAVGPQLKELFETGRTELVFEVDRLQDNDEEIVLFVQNLGTVPGYAKSVGFEIPGLRTRDLQFVSDRAQRTIDPGPGVELVLGPPVDRWQFGDEGDLKVTPAGCRKKFQQAALRLQPVVAGGAESPPQEPILYGRLYEFLCTVSE